MNMIGLLDDLAVSRHKRPYHDARATHPYDFVLHHYRLAISSRGSFLL
jgi:hypothetical protein